MEDYQIFSQSRFKLNLYFVSSNLTKISHILHLCSLLGISVNVYRDIFLTYKEDYSLKPEQALQESIDYVTQKLHRLGLFFIEDSAIIFHAFSRNGVEFPGLTTKEFFADNTFEQIDSMFRTNGNDRRATIVSRIGLHVPGYNKAEVFSGKVDGSIIEQPVDISPHTTAPWLSEKSPVTYFVPEGEHVPISNLSLEKSYTYDVRVKALRQMVSRLAQFISIAENSSIVLRRKPRLKTEKQLLLFRPPLLILSGYSCTGKTTSALYISKKYGFQYLEESNAVISAAKNLGCSTDNLSHFVNKMISVEGPCYFIKYLLDMYEFEEGKQSVVSGIRAPEEVNYLRSMFPNSTLLFIETPLPIRYQRHTIEFGESCLAFHEFEDLAQQEKNWGMEELRYQADFVIRNIGNFEQLFFDLSKLIEKLIRG